jgi:hypothetical protein
MLLPSSTITSVQRIWTIALTDSALASEDNCLSLMVFVTEIISEFCVVVETNIISTDPDLRDVRNRVWVDVKLITT